MISRFGDGSYAKSECAYWRVCSSEGCLVMITVRTGNRENMLLLGISLFIIIGIT